MAATFSQTPPVHMNCRCAIGPDGVWTDAGDARVCPYCMTLGAAWNLSLDEPPNEQEVDDLLDAQERETMRKAIERDSKVADAIISGAAEKATGGLVVEVATTGEPLTVAIEREATKRVAAAKAGAPLQPGRIIPYLGEITEPVWFEPAPFGRKRPVTEQIATVLIAETPTHNVVRKGGRYYIRTVGGKTVASDDNLALALLILLALAENERRKREERERERERAGGES